MNSSGAENAENVDASYGASVLQRASAVGKQLDRAIIVWIFVFALCAPHSIAAAQISWVCGMAVWVARYLFVRPRRKWQRTPMDYLLLGFFGLTVLAAIFSYDPDVSIGKLRAASLFTIVYLVAQNIMSRRLVRLLVLTLIASCMVNVVYTFGQRVIGRGVKVQNVAMASPLYAAGVRDGDTLLEVDGRKLHNPQELVDALGGTQTAGVGSATFNAPARIKIYHFEATPVLDVPRQLLAGTTALEKLGIGSWSRGRDWRASGFYGHYVTYAEVLQLILSLVLGLLVAARGKLTTGRIALLVLALLGLGGSLVLTVTRAPWLAFLISAFVIL